MIKHCGLVGLPTTIDNAQCRTTAGACMPAEIGVLTQVGIPEEYGHRFEARTGFDTGSASNPSPLS